MNSIINKVKQIVDKESSRKKYAVFDFDNTMIHNDIQRAVIAYMCEHKMLRNRHITTDISSSDDYHKAVYLYLQKLLKEKSTYEKAIEFANSLLSGYSHSEIINLVSEVIAYEGSEITYKSIFNLEIPKGIAIDNLSLQLKLTLEDLDIPVWFVSASSHSVIAGITEYFGWKNDFIGVRSELKDGVLTGKTIFPMSVREGKVACIKELIDPMSKPVLAAGDSTGDIPMLEYADIAVVVKNDLELLNEAQNKGWFILGKA